MFEFFPGNYMWSLAAFRSLATGGAVGEVVDVLGRLQEAAKTSDHEAWYREWFKLGDELRAYAEREEAEGHPKSAGQSYLRACSYYQWANHLIEHTDPRRKAAYQQSLDAFGRFAASVTPPIERVTIPFAAGDLPGWFVPGAGADTPKPTIVFFSGTDATKEQGYAFASYVAARGFNVLLFDGPGLTEPVLFKGMVNRYDEEVAGKAAIDFVLERADVDPKRIVLVGISFGGYRVARVAAFDQRIAACVAWGAQWDYHAVLMRRYRGGKGESAVPPAHLLHVFGAHDLDELLEKTKAWRLEPIAKQIAVPMLITHGQDDAQIPVEHAFAMYEGIGSKDKELKVFTKETRGSQHCQNDNRILAHQYVGDWLEDVLIHGKKRNGVIVGWERRS